MRLIFDQVWKIKQQVYKIAWILTVFWLMKMNKILFSCLKSLFVLILLLSIIGLVLLEDIINIELPVTLGSLSSVD